MPFAGQSGSIGYPLTHSANLMLFEPSSFDDFRQIARGLIAADVPPSEIQWTAADQRQPGLFGEDAVPPPPSSPAVFTIPKRFLELADMVAVHRSGERWELMYRVLFRLTHGERQLMNIETDDDVHQMGQMQKAVRRDIHKMKAFVRFRCVGTNVDPAIAADNQADNQAGEHYVAWHRPDHFIVPLAGPFFARRFAGMLWTILTPDASAMWDGTTLTFGPGADVSEAPSGDDLEDLWRTYYASIFNPARVKIKAMKAEMPVRHWPTLPESELIAELLMNADSRVQTMIDQTEGFRETASVHFPVDGDLAAYRSAAMTCTACSLCESATQTVFGRGPATARLMLVGEQPGDREDLAGEPFVGPAGKLLDDVLIRAGLKRDEIYLTNVVKHFKFIERGKRRIHKKPNSREIFACRPWLEAELTEVAPRRLVCLGATAAQAILGRDFRITKDRGQIVSSQWCDQTLATWHPSAILRMTDRSRQAEMVDEMVADLGLAGR